MAKADAEQVKPGAGKEKAEVVPIEQSGITPGGLTSAVWHEAGEAPVIRLHQIKMRPTMQLAAFHLTCFAVILPLLKRDLNAIRLELTSATSGILLPKPTSSSGIIPVTASSQNCQTLAG